MELSPFCRDLPDSPLDEEVMESLEFSWLLGNKHNIRIVVVYRKKTKKYISVKVSEKDSQGEQQISIFEPVLFFLGHIICRQNIIIYCEKVGTSCQVQQPQSPVVFS